MDIQIRLPRPYSTQQRILSEARRYNVLACGRRWGKSTVGTRHAIRPALAGFPVAYFFPTYKMMTELWRDMVSRCQPITKLKSEQEHRLELMTGGVIDMWSLTDPNAARGRKYKRALVDEAAMVDDLEYAWQGVIRPTLADYRGDGWLLSSPKGHNYFEQMFQWGQSSDYPDWQSWQRPTHDNPYIHPDELDALQHELPPLYYDQEVLAKFVDLGAGMSFLPHMSLWDACQETVPPLRANEPVVVALDAAKGRANQPSDCFAMVAVSRHWQDRNRVAVRAVRIWQAAAGKDLDFDLIERDLLQFFRFARPLIIVYDPTQLHQMAGNLRRIGNYWVEEFQQGADRLRSDKLLYDLIIRRGIAHDGDMTLRQHIQNADQKPDADKLRIVKRTESGKIDCAVALSMACFAIEDRFNL